MKYLTSFKTAAAVLLLAGSLSVFGQQQQGRGPGGPGGPGGPPGRGGRGGFPFGPRLSPEEMAAVQKINQALEAENAAVTTANSNLVAAAFTTPTDEAKIKAANDDLAKAREAWANKASKLMAENQASDHKLSEGAVAMLVRMSSGRGMFGFGPPPGFGRGGRGRGGFGSGGPQAGGRPGGPGGPGPNQ